MSTKQTQQAFLEEKFSHFKGRGGEYTLAFLAEVKAMNPQVAEARLSEDNAEAILKEACSVFESVCKFLGFTAPEQQQQLIGVLAKHVQKPVAEHLEMAAELEKAIADGLVMSDEEEEEANPMLGMMRKLGMR